MLKANMKANSFRLKDVTILGGPFKHAMNLNEEYLLQLEPDRLLSRFRKYANLEPKAPEYEGWESMTLSGHTLGHYLSACSQMYVSLNEDERFKERIDYIVDELSLCQEAHGDGYVSGIPKAKETFEGVSKGEIISKGFDLNGLWAPLYTFHKLFAGLRDAYHFVHNKKALQIEIKLADWLERIFSSLNDEQMQELMECEFGGINEVLADLYADTGKEKYLKLAEKFWHKVILDPLVEKKDSLPGRHANTQIPKIIGLARGYELTNDERRKETSEYFWDRVISQHTYVTGGNSFEEYFGDPGVLSDRLGPHTTETCNTYNMLKLADHLFRWKATAEVADYHERALLNHILASQHPHHGGVTYYLSLDMGGAKEYNGKFNHFTCCVGTGMENHSTYGNGIYYSHGKKLFVNQFIPSSLNWEEKGVTITQETKYPEEDSIKIKVNCKASTEFALNIRHPYWAEKGVQIKINGETQSVQSNPSSYIELERTWNDGDEISIQIPMTLRLEEMPDNSKRVAIMYGPLVLAGELGPLDDPKATENLYTPVFINEGQPLTDWIKPVPGKRNTFVTKNVGNPRDIELYPFYRMHDKLYSIFWDLFTNENWSRLEKEYIKSQENLNIIEQSTIDFVQPGEMQPERDHNFDGENTRVVSLQTRNGRTAYGGWMSFDMKVNSEEDMLLVITYSRDIQRIETEYDIYVEGEELTDPQEGFNETTRFLNVQHAIPKELYRGKNQITVKFQSRPRGRVRRIFGLRVVNKNDYAKLEG